MQQRKHITVSRRSRNFLPWHLLGSTESGVLRNRPTNLQASLFNLCEWTNRSGRKGFSLSVSSEFKTSRTLAALVARPEFFGAPEERNDITPLNQKKEWCFLFQSTGLRWLLAEGVFLLGGQQKSEIEVICNTFSTLSRNLRYLFCVIANVPYLNPFATVSIRKMLSFSAFIYTHGHHVKNHLYCI